jgi:VWFA-related protein
MNRKELGLASLVLLFAQSPADLQEKPAQSSQPFRVEATGVTVDVVVRDRRGRPVTNLTQADFEMTEDGVPQQITSFEVVGQPPSTASPGVTPSPAVADRAGTAAPARPREEPTLLALVFDRLGPEARDLARKAALVYVNEAHDRNQGVAVFLLDLKLNTIQPFTNDAAALRAAIEQAMLRATSRAIGASSPSAERAIAEANRNAGIMLEPNRVVPPEQPGQSTPALQGPSDPASAALAAMIQKMEEGFDQLEREQQGWTTTNGLLAIVNSLGDVRGRKTIVLLSEGISIPDNVMHRYQAVIDAANRANVSIYSLDAAGLRVRSDRSVASAELETQRQRREGEGGGILSKTFDRTQDAVRSTPESGLGRLANETGGRFLQDTNDVAASMRQVAEDARFHYLLGYSPVNQRFDGRFRRINVKVKRSDLQVRARPGYHAVPPVRSVVPVMTYEAPAMAALEGSTLPNAFPVRIAALIFPERQRPGLAPIVLEVGTEHLTFQQQPGTKLYTSDFTVLARFKDARGEVVRKVSQQYSVRGPMTQIEQARRGTVIFYKAPELPPGVYTLEAIVHDALSGKASARVSTVEIPKPDENALLVSSLMIVRRSEKVPEKDRDPQNPFYHGDLLLYPSLGEPLRRSIQKELSFLVTIIPAGSAPQATMSLRLKGQSIGEASAELPKPDATGRIQWVGRLPLEKFPAGEYELKVTIKDVKTQESRSARFTVVD